MVWYEGTGTSDKRFLISDQQGSIIATTNSVGTVLNISTYSPYGERTNTNATYARRFGYTGQADIPELNLQYYKARIYDPKLGRFLQSDPIGYDAGMNLYAYVTGDPINLVDPLGLEEKEVIIVKGHKLTDEEKCARNIGAANCYSGDRIDWGREALGLIPGYDLYDCTQKGCNTIDWVVAAAGVVPAGKSVKAAAKGSKYALKAVRNLGNPFKNLTAKQIEKMFMKKGFSKSGPNPIKGYGGYVNPKNGRSYHIDPKSFGKYPEDNHVDVNRLKGDTSGLDKKKLPYKQD